MSEREIMNIVREQEQDITEILTGSSLYVDMYPAEKQQLLHYLVTSYFHPVPDENCRTFQPAVTRPHL